ncbi:expressed unknown protein [Seminavis robusta]|uniref:Uncharacterized protein n=1 Tax=Seminavis robusta TaxID=568900 RepID=A0A9N8E791_9STRA|nr:expressed unknown protein [Seminavis robusta]|eukprot:Sro619_g176510.1 n/a (168) ;mRNA; f:46992-47495
MTSVVDSINRTLFFSDVPDGVLKHKPVERDVRDLSDVITNIGADIHSTLFFDDLQSVANQDRHAELIEEDMAKREQKRKEVEVSPTIEKEEPKGATMTFTELKKEMDNRTIPSPSLARIEKVNAQVAAEKREAELAKIAQGLEKQHSKMGSLMARVKKATKFTRAKE